MLDDDWRNPRNITWGALLAAIAVVLQIMPLYLLIIGTSLSSLSTLPVALASYKQRNIGLLTYISSGIIIMCWSVPQAIIFLCSSGLLGLCLGYLIKENYPFVRILFSAALILALGILLAGEILGIPVLPWLGGAHRIVIIPAVFLCSFFYTGIWILVLKVALARFMKY